MEPLFIGQLFQPKKMLKQPFFHTIYILAFKYNKKQYSFNFT